MSSDPVAVDWAALFRENAPAMLKFARRLLAGRASDGKGPEDIVQDVFTEVMRSGTLNGKHNPAGVLMTAVRRRCLDAIERGRRQETRPSLDDVATSAEDVAPEVVDTIMDRELHAILARVLTEKQRTALIYRVMLGYRSKDVAPLISASAQYVKPLVNSAITALKNDPEFAARYMNDNRSSVAQEPST